MVTATFLKEFKTSILHLCECEIGKRLILIIKEGTWDTETVMTNSFLPRVKLFKAQSEGLTAQRVLCFPLSPPLLLLLFQGLHHLCPLLWIIVLLRPFLPCSPPLPLGAELQKGLHQSSSLVPWLPAGLRQPEAFVGGKTGSGDFLPWLSPCWSLQVGHLPQPKPQLLPLSSGR